MTPELREARAEDASAVVNLWQACGLTRPWNDPHADFGAALATPDACVLVLADGAGNLYGTVLTGYDGHRGWIYYLAVAPDRQAEGHGRRLVVAAEAWLAAHGAAKVQLMVRDGNPVGEYYASLGYEAQTVTVWGRWLDGDRAVSPSAAPR
ncbi:GNAT family acetyltransferase [Ruania halotolerans]|uniref:GNAT family acetyltransferase n=1 Tax=Ruania halotolerans TaxID=2897773 RepID=UPI001E621CFB|nr:GNAT family acetyltransferase [Ruania halotolerans]UFU05678.1 GNAT family acetyltransferase [Ruania halotolerans]